LCQKGKAECTFFDHALQQTLPRSYVHSLLNRLARLRSVQITINGGILDPDAVPPPLTGTYTEHQRPISAHAIDPQTQLDWRPQDNQVSFDKHFSLEDANPTCWQYFGSSSAYALVVEVAVHASTRFGQLTHPENYTSSEFKLNQVIFESLELPTNRPTPSRQEIEFLVDLYMRSTNVIYGYSNPAQITAEVDTYLRVRSQATPLRHLTGPEAHAFFRVAMICAIASANRSRHHHDVSTADAKSFYVEAIQCTEEVTSDISLDALQALLLLILFAFFYPHRGDAWKLLDYACRLSVELNIHSEPNDDFESQESRHRRRSIFWGLYSLERNFGQHTGRPSDLPEEIITAEYPADLSHDPVDASYTQDMLVSHYYRLIYLRSEIFRVLYMPAIAPELPRSWYEDRLEDFVNWKNEVVHIVDAQHGQMGVGIMQVEIGFNTTINFLFQPLLLRALAATKDVDAIHNPSNTDLVIPRESYEAAVYSIDFYDRVFRAPEGTPEGDYPVSIVSAHYIHQATLTIMAHVLLAIDGRLPLVTFSRTRSIDGRITSDGTEQGPPIDFSNIREISEACLALLEHCATTWRGMIGLYDLFREMHEKVIPALLGR